MKHYCNGIHLVTCLFFFLFLLILLLFYIIDRQDNQTTPLDFGHPVLKFESHIYIIKETLYLYLIQVVSLYDLHKKLTECSFNECHIHFVSKSSGFNRD